MSPRRTVVLVGPGPTVIGGVARSVSRHASQLRGLGHRVVTIEPTVELFPGDVVRVDDGALALGVVDVGTPEPWCGALAEVLRQSEPDGVLGYYGTTHGAAAIDAARLCSVPAALMLRGNDVDVDPDDPVRRDRLLRALAGATVVTTVSREMASKVGALAGRDALVLGGAVDHARFRPDADAGAAWRARRGLGADAFVVGVFGELKTKRGLDRLRAATEDLRNVVVVLVGTIRPEVRAQLAPSWAHVPYLHDPEELAAAYNACDVVAQPSLADGRPNVVLEAMACARTIVATPVGGLVDLVEHGVTGYLPTDDAAWRRTIEALRARPEPALGQAARDAVPTLDREQRELEALLGQLFEAR